MATSAPDLKVNPVVDPQQVIASRDIVNSIYIDDRVKDYIVDVVWATRDPAAYNPKTAPLIDFNAYVAGRESNIAQISEDRAGSLKENRSVLFPSIVIIETNEAIESAPILVFDRGHQVIVMQANLMLRLPEPEQKHGD